MNKVLKNISVILECSFIGSVILYVYNFYTASKKYEILPVAVKNRLNIFVIRKVTTAFALYLLKTYENAKEMGVVISHDNRLYSRDFTLEAAKVLSTYGIKTYIFDSLRPTPVLSFATRYKKACGGIMITASHNPKEYNGYKVYDEEGCQIVPDKIKPMLDIISSLPSEIDIGYGKEKEAGD